MPVSLQICEKYLNFKRNLLIFQRTSLYNTICERIYFSEKRKYYRKNLLEAKNERR